MNKFGIFFSFNNMERKKRDRLIDQKRENDQRERMLTFLLPCKNYYFKLIIKSNGNPLQMIVFG